MESFLRRLFAFTVGFLVFSLSGLAMSESDGGDSSAVGPVPLRDSYRHVVHWEDMKQDINVDVVLPLAEISGKLPVVYVTDGAIAVPALAASLRAMLLGNELPPMIVIGISYANASTLEWLQLRYRDLTPTYDPDDLKGLTWQQPEEFRSGGADAFLDFIEREIKPMIRSAYPVSDDETLAGFSDGGLFTLHALFTRTDDYERYLAGSPTIWYDDKVIFSEEDAYARHHDDLDAKVFISVGALEQTFEDPAHTVVTDARFMADRLSDRAYPNLELTHHVFENETHLSVIPATYSRGLRALFAEDVRAMEEAAATELDE